MATGTDANVNEIRYVIERMCIAAPGAALAAVLRHAAAEAEPGDDGARCSTSAPTLNPIPFYRVTIRVDGPKNTASFLQAMLR